MANDVSTPPSAGSAAAPALARRLGALDATLIVMGGIIGAGIFVNPHVVAQRVAHPAAVLGVCGSPKASCSPSAHGAAASTAATLSPSPNRATAHVAIEWPHSGTGATRRPTSSSTIANSTNPRPAPPTFSGRCSEHSPASYKSPHARVSKAWPELANCLSAAGEQRSVRIRAAKARNSIWSSENEKSIVRSLYLFICLYVCGCSSARVHRPERLPGLPRSSPSWSRTSSQRAG
jgi:hypothetical protein